MNKEYNIDTGFYIVNLFNTENYLFDFREIIQRPSVVFKPSALRYKMLNHHGIIYYYNELGNVVSLQKIPDVLNSEAAFDFFKEDISFNRHYNLLLSELKNVFGYKLGDTDSSFIANVNEIVSDTISWEYVTIKNDEDLFILIEAAFIFQLCIRIDRNLSRLSSQYRNGVIKKIISRNIEDLFSLEHPAGFLVDKNEVKLMNEFYEKWSINNLITKLKERFDLSLANLNFQKDHDEKRQNNLMNLLLAGIAIFSATDAVPLLKKMFPDLNELNLEIVLFSLASLIILYSLYRYFFLEMFYMFKYTIQRKKIDRIINSNKSSKI